MLSFTTDFKAAATALTRDPRARVKIHWGNALQDTGVLITSNDANYIDRKGQITNGVTLAGAKWGFLGPEFLLDGTFKVMPSEDSGPQVGWFGATLSDGSGNFSTARYIQIEHDARPYDNLTIVGDDIYNEYPVDFDITFTYDGGTYVINITGNTLLTWTGAFSVLTGVTAVKVEVTKWSAPNTIVKILQVTGEFVETFIGDDILSLSVLEETNSDNGDVPLGSVTSNELDLELVNSGRRFSYGNTDSNYKDVLIPGRKIELWLGFALPAGSSDVSGDVAGYIVETEGGQSVGYMPYGVYWSRDWKSSYGDQVTSVTAFDMVDRLRNLTFFRSENYTGTIEDIVDDILSKARVSIPDLSWSVSSDTGADVLTNVSFPVSNYQKVLQGVAQASLSYTYVDRLGVLVVGSRLNTDTPVAPEQEIGVDTYFNFSSEPKIDELKNVVRVGYTAKDLALVADDIYTDETVFEIPAGETQMTLFLTWEKYPVDAASVIITFTPVSVSGPLVMASNSYAAGADVAINGLAGDTFTLSATGKPYTLTESTEVTAEDTDSVRKYGKREFEIKGNALITSADQAGEIASALLPLYGAIRNDGSLEWPCTSLVAVGDTVELTEYDDGVIETKDFFVIKRQNVTFNGALDGGLSVRR